MFKIKLTKKPKTGSQADYGLITNSTFVPTVSDREKVKQTMGSLTEEDIKNGKRPTIEVEGDEEVIGDIGGRGVLQKFRFKGPSHAEGGMPVDVPQGSFVYSKKLKMKDPEAQEAFGMKPKKEGYSFSDVAKKYDINTFVNTLEDSEADPFAKRTAQLMLQKNTEALARLADKQEETKGYPGGRAEITKQVLGVPDVPAQVQEVPPTMQEAQYGGSLRKAQWGGQEDLNTYSTMGNSTKDTSDFFTNAFWNNQLDLSHKDFLQPLKNGEYDTDNFKSKRDIIDDLKKNRPSVFNDALTLEKRIKQHNEPFKKAGLTDEFKNDYSKIAKLYKNAFYTGDPDVMLKAAKEISDSRGLTGDFPGLMDVFGGSDSDKFSDMASILQEEAGKKKTKLYLDKATELQKRAYKHYMHVKNSNDYSPQDEMKAKQYAEKLDRTKKMLQSNYEYDANRPFSSEGELSASMGVGQDMLDYLDKHSKIKTPTKQGTQKLKGREEFDYKFDPKTKVWTYSSDKTGGKFYEVTNLDAVKRLNKGEGYTSGTKEKSVLPVKDDNRSNSVYDKDLESIITSPQEKAVVKKQVVVQKPVQQVQQEQPVSHPVWNLDELAYGGEMLNKYQGTEGPSTVVPTTTTATTTVNPPVATTTAQQPIEETITGTSGQTYKSLTYPDGSTKLFKSDGTLHSEKPAGTVNYANVLKAKNTPAVATKTTVAPERHSGQFSQYGSPEIQKYLASNENIKYTKYDKGSFGNQKLQGNTGIYLSSNDAAAHSSGNLSADEWKDFGDRHGDWIDKEYPGGLAKFENDLASGQGAMKNASGKIIGHNAADWFQKKVNEKSIKATGVPYFTTGNQSTPYNADQKFGHVTYSVPRFFDLEKPETQIETIPGEKPKEEPSKDKAEFEPGDPLEKMPPKTPGWYLQDMVNFGAALGQKTADFRPVKGSVNASMTGYTLEDPTTAQNTLQANQGRVQDQIENTTSGPIGTAVAIGAAGENAANSARIASENEGKNTAITNQAFAQNSSIQNQQNTTNAGLFDKFVKESADFGNAKIKEENMKKAQVAEMFNKGTEHEFKRKQFEQVLFPQTAMNPITGDWYTGGKGRDIFGPDPYSPAYGSSKGKTKDYEQWGKEYDDALAHFTSKGYDNPKDRADRYMSKRDKTTDDDDYRLNNKQLMMQSMMKLIFGGSI
jgi:hypothetical protein